MLLIYLFPVSNSRSGFLAAYDLAAQYCQRGVVCRRAALCGISAVFSSTDTCNRLVLAFSTDTTLTIAARRPARGTLEHQIPYREVLLRSAALAINELLQLRTTHPTLSNHLLLIAYIFIGYIRPVLSVEIPKTNINIIFYLSFD